MSGLAGGILAATFVGVLFLAFLGVALVVGLRILRRERERTEELSRAAAGLGYTFAAKPEACPVPVRLPLLNCGRDRQATNVLRGPAGKGGSELVFDWNFVSGWGKHRRTYRQTVMAFPEPAARLPVFALRPEVFLLDKINELLGDKDIDFSGSPDFSRAYHLNAADEAAGRALFTDAVLAHLAARPGWTVETGDGWFLVSQFNHRPAVSALPQFIAEARAIRRLFP